MKKEAESPDNALDPITRRRFLGSCSGCLLAAAALTPRAASAAGRKPIDVGPLKDFATEAISEKFVRHDFFVIRHGKRLYATIATCPHEGNYLFRDEKGGKKIVCSGHDSVFDAEGKPVSGRVKKGLVRFGIAVDKRGHVLVNKDLEFPQAKWNEKLSYVPVK